MSKITTREELINYIRLRLGSPCLSNSDLTDEQMDSIIDCTLDRFYEQAIGFAQEERILYLPVTCGVGWVDISDVSPQPTACVSVIGDDTNNIWSNFNVLFTLENMMLHRWGFNLQTPDLLTFQMMNDWLDFFRTMYGRQYQVEINEHGKYAKVLPFPQYDGSIFTVVYVKRAEEELYHISWVREYSLAKCLIQIGMNRSKFTGVTLPGGGTVNAEMYITKGEAMVEKLEEQLLTEWQEPIDFIIG